MIKRCVSIRLPLLALAALATVAVAGCASNAGDATGESSESLTTLVHLPTALGGMDRVTKHAPHVTPLRVFPTGLPITSSRAHAHGGLEALSNPPPQLASSVDLSANAPAPGDQGQTGSCGAWSTGYSSMGFWANKTGASGAPFAPMFLYAQEVHGACDQGTSIEGNMDILQQQGIDTNADYEPMQQSLDCATQPNAAQRANAASYKITGYQQLDLSVGKRQAIEQMLSAGNPVVLGILAYSELMNANAQSYLVGPPAAGSTLYGGHAIAAFKYDDNGVWILNSWTSQWGNAGWAELSWDFIDGTFGGKENMMDAAAITGVAFGGGGGGGGGGSPPPPQSSGPTVSFASPADGSTIHGGDTVNIVVGAADAASTIASASLDWQSPSGHSTFVLSDMGSGQWGGALTLSAQAASGARVLTVTVTDANGQTAAAQETLTVP